MSPVDPGKWPRLVVTGTDVTPTQADEIIIRTTDLNWLTCNDPEWENAVNVAFGIVNDRIGDALQRTRNLRVRYLANKRIATSWIGGPHGWCDWTGAVGTNTYNLGKWPAPEVVVAEWATIAAAFPYLELESWLVADEGAGSVAAHWGVRAGKVEALPLGEPPPLPDEFDTHTMIYAGILDHGSRHGVTLERLYSAIARTERGAEGLERCPKTTS
ncbi:hypothetical protein LO763_22540 [Glycomyces sp. A-F 0318]|uniref:hypothetical protein n=1 Tax=Glycomyces amatae TaxID=2881355 RepID=UPI001E47B263|nr:hypothetical protein [Glycomyces amatae]MCD0446398.1 hypothetical protein [Glycomyces amatae]